MTTPGHQDEEERPGRIDAVEVRHPWRWVALAVIAVLALMLLHLLLTNDNFDWPFTLEVMNQTIVIRGFLIGTLFTTVCAMVIGIVGGVLLAILRLSDNRVLSSVSWVFTWFFRAVPRYVLLSITGGLGALFATGLSIGVPFDFLLTQWFGTPDLRLLTVSQTTLYALFGGVFGGILGLGFSEAAYMAEIARAGMLSVDRGQHEAAEALGMSKGLAMRRVILPQAMRVIVPPTGNEVIAMLKDTSLLAAIPVSTELFFRVSQIKNRTFEVMAGNMAAVAYYLIATSILMVGQYFLEKRFSRGYGTGPARRTTAAGVAMGPGGAK
ncbi:amino acid ABC transporter permease [Kineococcus sp. SYSU DK002]|uniref:amino acid ABC transporter permease n=1 Tax=Kineococcus sp. SYSU DK002 TaxID=3383123 RepID=UPI003D7D8DFF